ncbi:K+-transporting ATPase, B subunit [Hydrogenobacter thermophilus TK-6]|uniref:Potassium-transporting ATPase ATP-binding subunit n=1 Tax=Hydrogenobacter thermophilus (strain DSM 6534 / IAM 12695 / TK-6) TaxID=608538 RepID=D3DFQ2_HYDTT|nr:potassium-transporting ATPase subunit KdpB [Hydrogenobacter thermophilus]ADO44598.1 K+-transporting ATPase, B subunit [Hydrogenobacter thermophilus TK-6]BAI68654.1 potassium-transporting ATPase B chain [Hydrogenobacter thermophilus TK-6]
MKKRDVSVFNRDIIIEALLDSFRKLNPLELWRNPVIFLVEVASLIITIEFFLELSGVKKGLAWFSGWTAFWLWLTVIFSNFAESLSEIRGKARAESLKSYKTTIMAKKLESPDPNAPFVEVPSTELKKGDFVLVQEGELISGDGEIVVGAALVNEAAVTGESAPVLREAGSDRSAVLGGTKVVAGNIVVRITANPGETFLDKMISMIEGAKRRKTLNEIALEVLLVSLTVVFLLVAFNARAISEYLVAVSNRGEPMSLAVLASLFVSLAPTTIAALLPAIGIAGMDRLFRRNVIALSGRAIEAAGDANVLLLDKTGTITLGNRMASEFIPVGNHSFEDCVWTAMIASIADETPEGKSIMELAKKTLGVRSDALPRNVKVIPFTPETKMSGVEVDGHSYRKGAFSAVRDYIQKLGGEVPHQVEVVVAKIAMSGGTPLVVVKDKEVIGVVALKDVLKQGIKARLARLRSMGIKSIMITGDNPLTAAAIAKEAGVDDFVAEAKPEDKLKLVKELQAQGYVVAMTGDGTNDAPALAQADVAVAMNAGTQAAREAANIIDLDSDPSKLLDIVEVGKSMLITRGTLTTFSIANDIAKYFVIVPASVAPIYPDLNKLNILHLENPYIAILSAVIFNALVIPALTPLALKGAFYKPISPGRLFLYNLLVYGLGGIIAPFVFIKLIYHLIELFVR